MKEYSLSEKELRQAVEEWQATFDAIPDLVSIIDRDFRIRAVNTAFTNAFNIKPENLLGKKCHEIIHHTEEPWPDCPQRQSNERDCVMTKEFQDPRLGLFLQVTCSPIRNEQGEPVGTIHIARDITERKKAEEILRQSLDDIKKQVDRQTHELNRANEHLTTSIERMRSEMEKCAIAESAMEERMRFETVLSKLLAHFVNLPADQIYSEIEAAQRRICELLALDRSGLWQVPEKKPGTLMLTHVHPPLGGPPSEWPGSEFFPWTTKKLLDGEIVSIAKMSDLSPEACLDRESFQRWGTKATVVVPLSTGGRVVGALSFARFREEGDWPESVVMGFQLLARVFANALARKRADDDLRESEQRLSLAADSAGAVLWSLNLTTGRYWATEKFRELFGVSPDEVVTFDQFLDLVHHDDREMIRQAVQATVRCREECNIEYRIPRPDGSVRWMALRGRVDCTVSEEPDRIMGAFLDITRRKRMEAQMQDRIQEIENLRQQFEKENVYLREEYGHLLAHEEIIGESDAIRQVLGQVEQVAPTDSTVLITGETGTGKELIARALHSLSKRKGRAMVKVDCAALPSTLIESELFGREKGAYTGAMTKELGRFELADGSTLFLDEVGELSNDLQAKLLRVLQSGEFERLGSPKTIRVDVRVIAATNRNLAEHVKKGIFREDLYYRLNVFPIEMPSLRQRPEDIPRLVRSFVKEFNKKMGKNINSIPRKIMESLLRYNWPGNIRELRNVIEHAVIVSNGEVLNPRVPKNSIETAPPIRSLEEVEYQYIVDALEKTSWRIKGPKGAAEILKLKPSTLYNKMNKLGIPLRRK